ncbi:EF-hand domain-containing protein [Saccharothrix sp. Mg75]|uniref:EF-hand domain-containing protein n=1 Tax=Saccharothrix sp. Mg75 TaxID=3445357 RepID=UPI003EEBF3FD
MAEQVPTGKVDRAFAVFDVNGGGRLRWTDFEAEAACIGEGFGRSPDSAEVRGLVTAYEQVWEYVCGAADVNRDGVVTKDEFERAHRSRRLSAETVADLWTVVSDRLFAVADRDGDGRVDQGELVELYRAGRVVDAERAAEAAFAGTGVDGDGRVDQTGFTATARGLFAEVR